MLELQEKENIIIENLIYEIRGKQVMFARDVATLYNEETRRINEVVKRNINRFPEDFCFQLTKEETDIYYSRSQFAILNNNDNKRGSNIKYLPYVFTEHGIMMLSSLLKSDIAAKVNVSIINAFVSMRRYISSNLLEQKYINNQVMKNTEDIKLLQESFKEFDKKKELNDMFFEGQFYDAYSLLIDILSTATKNIIIIDNYINKKFLDICAKIKVNIIIYTKEIDKMDLDKYNKQYNNIKVRIANKYHDRFIIIDNKILYHCGASFKDLGKKCFCISKIENDNVLKELLKIINS